MRLFFLLIIALCMASIQVWFIIKSGHDGVRAVVLLNYCVALVSKHPFASHLINNNIAYLYAKSPFPVDCIFPCLPSRHDGEQGFLVWFQLVLYVCHSVLEVAIKTNAAGVF